MVMPKYRRLAVCISIACGLVYLSLLFDGDTTAIMEGTHGVTTPKFPLISDFSKRGFFEEKCARQDMDLEGELNQLKSNPEYFFDWCDWVNTDHENISFNQSTDAEIHAIIAGSEFIKHMEHPSRIIILPDSAQFLVNSSLPSKTQEYDLQSTPHEKCQVQYGVDSCLDIMPDPFKASNYDPLVPDFYTASYVWPIPLKPNRKNLLTFFAETKEGYADMQMNAILKSYDNADTAEEYFREPENIEGHHDYRFFGGKQNLADTAININSLFKAWSTFSATYNIESTVAQGSAIGYMWNGYSLPYDDDLDIHVPIHTVHRLAWEFNATLFVQKQNQRYRAFYLDINPWYTSRNSDNNLVDGRFIDITTGKYIDIAGLSMRGSFVTCKAKKRYKLTDASLARLVRFEGSLTYLPRRLEQFMENTYPNMSDPVYKNWMYNPEKGMWLDTNTNCQYPVQLFEMVPCEEGRNKKCSREVGYYCRKNDQGNLINDYIYSHEEEIKLLDSVPFEVQSSIKDWEDNKLFDEIRDFFAVDKTNIREELAVE